MKRITNLLLAVTAIAVLPGTAAAGWHPWSAHRHAEREQWKDVALASGALGIVGAVTHNSTLAAVGLGGAIYGGVRYENEVDHGYYRYDHRRWDDRRWRDHRYGWR